jgi:hypothetical protein
MFKTAGSALALATALAIASPPTQAMTFRSADAGNSDFVITMQGEIVADDAAKLAQFLQTLPATARVVSFWMDSPGGLVNEAIRMGQMIVKSGAKTVLPANVTCASACFWLFAAGQHREMVSSAQLGVHGAATRRVTRKRTPQWTWRVLGTRSASPTRSSSSS